MRDISQLHEYQKSMVMFQCSRNFSMIWADMGLGKTAVTLTSIAHLINTGFLNAVVIVAPIRVCRLVWRQEALKWSHTKDLTFSMLVGTKDQRTRALLRPANIYLVNFENLGWLSEVLHTYFISKNKPLPFTGIVYDEISKCKNSSTNRVKALKKVLDHFVWRTGLTGTPASNGYKDLHGQFLVVDGGERLGTSKTQFKQRFYKKEGPFREVAFADTEDTIKRLIGDITLEMSAADYNPLPDMIVNDIEVELPDELRAKYDQMERELFIQLDSGQEVEVFNQAALTNKCLAEGTEILTDRGWIRIEKYTNEKVWDGVEWVNTSGLLDQGYKNVIECWGVEMTPDHKVLSNDGWIKAEDIINDESRQGFNWSSVRLPHGNKTKWEQENRRNIRKSIMVSSMYLRKRVNITKSEFEIKTSTKNKILWMQTRGKSNTGKRFARYDRNPTMDNMEKYAIQMFKPIGQRLEKLWRKRGNYLRGMGIFREILDRYVTRLSITSHTGTKRRKRELHEIELSMGKSTAAGKQYPSECINSYTDRSYYGSSSCSSIQIETDNHIQENRTGMVRRNVNNTRKVYDLINAGPRHRFTVRGKNGEIFISHNCLQISNGAIYPIAGVPLWEPLHEAKLDALEEIIDEVQGSPVLCSYAYRSDAERIMKRFEHLNPINLTECKSESSLANAMDRWKRGDCALMIGHPASMGHGVDGLQSTGNTLVWFGLNWSLDLYEQFNARIRRQGQGKPVICHRILCRDTLDQAQALALQEKATTQDGLRRAIKQYRQVRQI